MIESYSKKGIDIVKRIAQLESLMQPADVEELLGHRKVVQEYCRLGDHWREQGCFRVEERSTRKTGKEVMLHSLNPEGYLAILVDEAMAGRENAGAFEQEMDRTLVKDPKALARRFMEEALILDKRHSEQFQVARRISDEYRDDIETVHDSIRAFQILGSLPVAERMKPSWFQVIDHYQLGPSDLEAFFNAIDSDTWKGAQPGAVDTNDVRLKIHRRMGA